jgi:hypothetical protein
VTNKQDEINKTLKLNSNRKRLDESLCIRPDADDFDKPLITLEEANKEYADVNISH